MRICAADVTVELNPTDTAFFAALTAEYRQTGDAPVQMVMESRVTPHIDLPEGEKLFTAGRAQVMRLPDGEMAHYVADGRTGRITQFTRYTPDFSRVRIWLSPSDGKAVSAAAYEYAYTGYEFANRLSALGGAVLHGSAIAYRGEGLIFSAPSGTGKSTHTALWKRCYGEGVTYINDDKPALLFPASGRPLVCGTPWSGKTALHHNIRVPLRAIVFLERGTGNRMRRLSPVESMFHLSEEMVRPYTDARLGEQLVERMTLLMRHTPVWLLTCTPEPAAAAMVRKTLFDGQLE